MVGKIIANRILAFGVTALNLFACSAGDDAASPGLCELRCSGAKIAGNDARFRYMGGLIDPEQGIATKLDCSGVLLPSGKNGVEYLGPVTLQFMAESIRGLRYKNPFDTPSDVDARDSADDSEGKLWSPLAGIAFEPIMLRGLMAGDRTSTENATVDANGQVSPYKYAGIVTPKSEWCTDTCGVATIEVWPICIADSSNSIQMVIHSGGLYADPITIDAGAAAAAAPLHSDIDPGVEGTLVPPETGVDP